MTKDSVKHKYSGVDGFSLIKKKKFILNENESYPVSDVIGYKCIYKRYGNVKNFVLEYSLVDGEFVPKYVPGRINVFDSTQLMMGYDKNVSKHYYYLQKGDAGEIVELTVENAKTKIYDMLKDYAPSKNIMDSNGSSFQAVVDAVNAYNIRD